MTIAVFIIFMATLALVDGFAPSDCQAVKYVQGHKRFLCRHVLQESIPDKTDKTAWTTYIRKYGLCDRLSQSFMPQQRAANKICEGYFEPRVYTCSNQGAFCTSNSPILLYHIRLDSNCQVTNLYDHPYFVVVSCEKVGNLCRPTHFERTENIRLDWTAQPCR